MPRKVNMMPALLASLFLACSVGLPGTAFAAPSTSESTSAGTCYAVADTPQYSGGNIVYSGRVNCSRPQSLIEVEVNLTMKQGSYPTEEVADTNAYCEDEKVCADFGLSPNRSGNQQWCTVVEAWVPGQEVRTARSCETQNW